MTDAATKRNARNDDNQPEIIKTLTQLGITVENIKVPADLMVAKRAVTVIVEVKNPKQKASDRRLTDNELLFYNRWTGLFCVIETKDDCRDLNAALVDGFRATFAYCEKNMQDHFRTCYNRRGKNK